MKLGLECKRQRVSGSTQEKIPPLLEDIDAWGFPGKIVVDGPRNGKGISKRLVKILVESGKLIWYEDLKDFLLEWQNSSP
jgi:hypothetical protein